MLKFLARATTASRRRRTAGRAAAPAEDVALWDQEYKRQRFRWASERVRGEVEAASWQAFWRTAVEGQGAARGREGTRHERRGRLHGEERVLDRIRKQIQQLEDE